MWTLDFTFLSPSGMEGNMVIFISLTIASHTDTYASVDRVHLEEKTLDQRCSSFRSKLCARAANGLRGWVPGTYSAVQHSIVEVKINSSLGISGNIFDEHSLINIVLNGHFRVRKYDIPVEL